MVVVQQTAPIQEEGMLAGAFNGLPNLSTFLFVGAVIIIGILIYLWWKHTEELKRSKEDNIFYDYLSTKAGCEDMARKDYIDLKYNWLFLLFPPLFLLGFLLKKDYSVPVKDLNNKLLGRYRGEQNRNDGTFNLMVADGKKYLIFDNLKIIKFLRGFEADDGRWFSLEGLIQYYPSQQNCKYIQVQCTDIEEYKYFYLPHIVDKEGRTVQLRGAMARKFMDVNNDINIMEMMVESNQQIQKAFKSNAELGYRQREPQEIKELSEG